MKFGVQCFNWEPFVYHPALYEDIAKDAEKLGYDSFLVSDHFLRPFLEVKPECVGRQATLDAWALLAYLAGKTQRIRIGSCVTPLPLRNPMQLAKMVAAVDILSQGRLIFGVGAGDDLKEFQAYGTPNSNLQRVERTREALQLMIRLWTEEIVTFEGKFYSVKDAVLEPKPVQKPYPPIWVGAMHSKMLELTREMGDCWIPAKSIGATTEFYQRASGVLGGGSRKLTLGLMGNIAENEAAAPLPILGPMKDAAKIVESYRKLGCEYLVLAFLPPEKTVEHMTTFAREILPSFA